VFPLVAAVPVLQLSVAYWPMGSLPGKSYSDAGFGSHEEDVPLSLANGSMSRAVHEPVLRFRYKLIQDRDDRT